MTSKRVPALGTDTTPPAESDDFQLVSGIGPAVEKRLRQGGVHSFAQLAALSPDDVAQLLNGLIGWSAARVAEADLIGQARALAPEPVAPESKPWITAPGNGQHYATFTVGLLLDADNSVRRTLVEYIQSEGEEPGAWAGWDANRMVEFIIRRAALKLPAAEPAPALAQESERAEPPAAPIQLSGLLRLDRLETLQSGVGPRSILPHDQPFIVELFLDLNDVDAPGDDPLECTAAVYAKSLSGGPQQIVAQTRDTIVLEDSLAIAMEGVPLSRGIYRLEATVTLALPAMEPSLSAHLEGGLLQVF